MKKLILPLMMYKESGSKKKGTWKQHNVVPSWNHLYTIVNNRPILSKWALQHYENVKNIAKEWVEETGWKLTEKEKLVCNVWVYFPNKVKRDTHNLTKILDPLQGIIYDDDHYVLVRFQDFEVDKEHPRIELTFERLGEG